jgi:hypothetical protein
LAPESALGLLPSIALSSAQAERILTKTEPVPCGWTKQSLDNFYIAGVNERSGSPLEYAPEKPHTRRGAGTSETKTNRWLRSLRSLTTG